MYQLTRLIKEIAQDALAERLRELGFDRANLTWRRRPGDDIVQVIDVQMSGHRPPDGALMLNAGVYFPALARRIGDFPVTEQPEEHDCQLRKRSLPYGKWLSVRLAGMAKVDPEAGRVLGALFSWLDRRADARADLLNERAKQELREGLDRYALPWLERVSTLSGARDELVRQGPMMWAVAATLELGDRGTALALFRRALESATPEPAEHLREWGQANGLPL